MAQENISAQLNDLLASRDFQAELLDKEGRPTDAENADIFTFDYVSSGGKNYGTMVIILDADNEMQVFYGDNLGRSMEGDDKTEFFDFVQHLHKFANMRRWTYSPKNINQVKYTMKGLAAIKEGLFEGYYGTRKVSYSGEPTEARLVIQHNRTLGEADARFRYVESLFIETADSERYRLQFKNLAGGRAMLEHVRQGGKPYDVRGCHITEMVAEIATLSRFNRASAGRVLEGVTAELVTEAQQYYKSLRENLKRMAGTRGYQAYFESWHPAEATLQEELVDSIKTMFVEQTLDSRIEAALPVLARLQQENRMKEADIFESWADNLSEGTWALPDTPEKHQRLQDLMSRPLIVGPDATNATEQLDDLVGDDRLFDYLESLADRDASANVWDDTDVQARLGDLGIQLPGQPPEDDADDVAADDAAAGADQQPPVQESRVKELSMDLEDPLMSDEEFETKYGDSRENMQHRAGRVQDRKTGRFYDPDEEFDKLKNSPEFGAQMRRMSEGYPKHQDLSGISTDKLKAYLDKQSKQQVSGEGNQVKRVRAELQRRSQGVAEGMSRDEYNQIQYAIDNFKDEYGEEPSGPDIFNIADSLGVEPDAVINVLYGRIVPEQGVAEAGNQPVDHEWYRKQQERKAKAAKRQDQQQTQSDVVESLLSEYETGLDGDQVLEDNLPEAKMSPQQQNDFDRMRYGAMSRKEYDAKWKKPQKSDDQVIYGKKPAVAETSTCNHTQEGEMCPEHGLAECGMHESQVQESQQHLADLARLKSLAHGK